MKLNLFALGRAARVLIVTVVVFSIIGLLLCPELMQYTPEDPDLLSNQRNFSMVGLAIGLFAGCLTYWESIRNVS